MKAFLTSIETSGNGTITITGSKSESNRLLILQAPFPDLEIDNLSNSDDTRVLKQALTVTQGTVDIHHAGTAMRFLTAYFASQPGKEVVITGSERMQERPIEVLVTALRSMGAKIDYLNREGYPPLKIQGTVLEKNMVSIQANVSSQYISALMLIAASLPSGLEIKLLGEVTSVPYILMTLSLLKQVGIEGTYSDNTIAIAPRSKIEPVQIAVESDWSSASYYYSLAALTGSAITLKTYKENSLQGDAALSEIYRRLAVETRFDVDVNSITLQSNGRPLAEHIILDLVNTPDIAQTIAVTCFGLGIGCTLTGLHTLKIKETDRLVALQQELSKLGASISVTDNSLTLKPATQRNEWVSVDTYNDHRMAMAFAPLAAVVPLIINDPEVVSKSYPDFWKDLQKIGAQIEFK